MSEVDDLSFVVDDGVLSDFYTVMRSTGTFQLGGWVTTPTNIQGYGVVSVANNEDLEMIPEGDRVTGAMVFHSQQRIYLTQLDAGYGQSDYGESPFGVGIQRVSDILVWNFQQWRVLHVGPYPNRNYWKAIAVRLAGV
jgi:hypothetical protein